MKAAVALVIAAVLVGIAPGVSADQYTDQIKAAKHKQAQVDQEIASLRAQIAAAKNQEAQLRAIIGALDTQIAATEAQVAVAQVQLQHIEADLAAAQARLVTAQNQLAAEKRQLSRELVVIYELQQQSTPIRNLLKSGNFNDFWTQLIDSRRISAVELRTVYQIQAKEDEIHGIISQISTEKEQQAAVVDQLQTTQNQLTQQRAAQQTALNDLAALQAKDEQLAQQWTAVENQINAQIAHLQAEEAAALAAGGGHGRFVWPDSGPISQGFGCTPFEFEAYDPHCPSRHFHNGIDIAGPCGNNIVAADSGIAYLQPYDPYGFGNYIIMVHGNGWETLYGHMDGFAVGNGQIVTRGQQIGWEGSSGNSTGCHLHFSVNHNNQWVNPLSYLS